MTLSKKKCSFTSELFSPKHLGMAVGVKGCSRAEREVVRTGEENVTLFSGNSKRRERGSPSPNPLPPGYQSKPAPTSAPLSTPALAG